MTNIPIQSLPAGEGSYSFAGEAHLDAIDKQHILEDWQRFMTGGFRQRCFTQRLYDFLCHSCAFVARRNRLTFWTTYFNAEAICLRLFLNQFGGNGRSVDYSTHAWLEGPAADLKQAMCRETARLYAPLLQVLEALEQKHAELGQVWQTFALRQVPPSGTPSTSPLRQAQEAPQDTVSTGSGGASGCNSGEPSQGRLRQAQDAAQDTAIAGGIPGPGFPPYYLISENTRNMLAYVAHTTLDQSQIRLKGEEDDLSE